MGRVCVVAGLMLALTGCGGGGNGAAKTGVVETGDRELLAASGAAQQAFARGAYEPAAEAYRRALMRARLQDDAALIADQAYNLGICLMALGQNDAARERLAEAEGAMKRAGLPLADVLLAQARLAYRASEGHAELRNAASIAATRVLDDPSSKPADIHRLHVLLLRTELACDKGDAAAAMQELTAAQTLAATIPGTAAAGLAHGEGRVLVLKKDWTGAAAAFDREASLQRKAARYSEMAKALRQAGEAYAKAADPQSAADRLYRAALSLSAQEKYALAQTALDQAGTSAAQAGDGALAKLIAALRAEIKEIAPPAAVQP